LEGEDHVPPTGEDDLNDDDTDDTSA